MRSLEEHFETAHDRKMLESLSISTSDDTTLPPPSSSYSAFLSSEAEKERQERMAPAAEIASASALGPQFPMQNVLAPRDLLGRKRTSRSVFLGFAGLILFWSIFTTVMVHQNLSKYGSLTQITIVNKPSPQNRDSSKISHTMKRQAKAKRTPSHMRRTKIGSKKIEPKLNDPNTIGLIGPKLYDPNIRSNGTNLNSNQQVRRHLYAMCSECRTSTSRWSFKFHGLAYGL